MGINKGQQALADYKFQSSYAKFIDKTQTKEVWEESVNRIMEMHYTKLKQKLHVDELNPELIELLKYASKHYNDKLILGSQRALQFGGDPILKHEGKMYNCLTSYADRPEFFNECMYWLLCGCGVGFSVQNKHIAQLPTIAVRDKGVKTFIVPDSVEGWSDAIGVLIGSYFQSDGKFSEYKGYRIDFDYSQIRPKGSFISGGFKAPGPDGLRNSLIKIEELLNLELRKEFFDGKVRSIVAYDIVMHMSDAVLSGGVRRSATICLFSIDDLDMMNAKTGNWFEENPQRARSNNSVLLIRDETSKEQFDEILRSVKDWGEPGFVWSDSEDILYNPCVEIGMFPQTEDGVSGWQGCNLIEINGLKCIDRETFLHACRAAAILGTIQACYTDFRYVPNASKEIFEREALLGCSITGWMNNPDLLFDEKLQQEGALLIKQVNQQVAELIGINQAARTTCVKPAGNTSVLLGTASGIHGDHSPMYFRNIQVNKLEDEAEVFLNANKKAVEESVWSASKNDWIFSFPIVSNKGAKFKKDLLGVKQLEYVKMVQENWVEYGTNVDLCVNPNTRHNVSNTITVDNWEEVGDYIYENRKSFAGVSLLNSKGDKDYNQAPFIAVYKPDEMLKEYGNAVVFASGLIVDGLHVFNNNLWAACGAALGYGDFDALSEETVFKKDWIRRAKKFADNYFKGDVKKMTYCLKDIHNYHRWIEIERELTNINWKEIKVKPSYTNIDTLGSISCVGGSCEI